ncbi:MAG: hypothetical protein ABFE08_13775 [Armatimonadia bacterium]
MPRHTVNNPEESGARVQRALYHRCRRGEREALATLLYRLVDRLYVAATFVAPDEPSAQAALILAWEDLLALLTRPYVGGHLSHRAFDLLGARLADYADRATVRRHLRNAQQQAEEGLLSLPEEQLQPLVDLIGRYADEIAHNHRVRTAFRRRTWIAAAAAVLVTLGGLGWLRFATLSGATDVQLACLQDRIIKHELAQCLRDQAGELPDPDGADQGQARTLQRASLVLDEIANARPQAPTLTYLVTRIEQEALVEDLSDIAQQSDEFSRRDLLQARLALEEVAAL